MKCLSVLPVIAALASLVACDTSTGPMMGSGIDPLRQPGSNLPSQTAAVPAFTAGQFVQAAIENTAFFKSRPSGNADADKLLQRETSMKVISISGSYVKVELDSGEVGFVPSVMIEDPKATIQPLPTSPNEYQIYPPLPGNGNGIGEPLPRIDSAGQPPANAIPTETHPDAPSSGSMPLPPNGEEKKN